MSHFNSAVLVGRRTVRVKPRFKLNFSWKRWRPACALSSDGAGESLPVTLPLTVVINKTGKPRSHGQPARAHDYCLRSSLARFPDGFLIT